MSYDHRILTLTKRPSTEVAAVEETPRCGDVTDGIEPEDVSEEPEAVATDVRHSVVVRRHGTVWALDVSVEYGTGLSAVDG